MAEYKYTAEEIMRMFKEYHAYKSGVIQEWRLVRSLYRGDFWGVFKKHLEDFTLTPDWNYIEYVVQAYLNSVYSGAFIGTISPRRIEDSQHVEALNAFIAYNWNKWGIKNSFLSLGENAELYNWAPLRVDWDTTNNCIKVSCLAAEELYADPSCRDYRDGEALFIERAIDIHKLEKNTDFKDEVEKFITVSGERFVDKTLSNRLGVGENRTTSDNKKVSLIECFIRNDEGGLDQVFVLNEERIIHERLDIGVPRFPVVVHTPQKPDAGPYGRPKMMKIINTAVALNLLDSMEATQPHRLLNRVRFVNSEGKINMRSFADFGNTPGASFEVRGDPRTLIHYEDVPVIPDMTNLKNRLENGIFQVTGVDPHYKGRTTNSLQTTGATQAFQARVTMLTDNSRIAMLETFCEDLTRLILDYYFEYGDGAHYEVPRQSANGTNRVIGKYNVDFARMKEEGVAYDYMIDASTLLPMNLANLFESARALYEMQGQYNFSRRVITEEELVRYSDLPQKDLILQRLAREEQEQVAETLIADLTNFANIFSKMLAQGVSEEEAAQQAIAILVEEKNAMKEDPTLGRGFE